MPEYRDGCRPTRAAIAIWCAVVCGCGPTAIEPPDNPPPLISDRFPDAQLKIEGRDPAAEQIVLRANETFAYAGSFRLADPADKTLDGLLSSTAARLFAAFEGGEAEVFTDFPERRVEGDLIFFEGEMTAGPYSGEVELRITVTNPLTEDVLPVYRTIVTVEESSKAK